MPLGVWTSTLESAVKSTQHNAHARACSPFSIGRVHAPCKRKNKPVTPPTVLEDADVPKNVVMDNAKIQVQRKFQKIVLALHLVWDQL